MDGGGWGSKPGSGTLKSLLDPKNRFWEQGVSQGGRLGVTFTGSGKDQKVPFWTVLEGFWSVRSDPVANVAFQTKLPSGTSK